MKVLPHLTERDLQLSQDAIVKMQREDLELLQGYAHAFLEQARDAADKVRAPVVIMCNVLTSDVQPCALDWLGESNVLRLAPVVYGTAKRALEARDPVAEVVVLLYHPNDDVLSIYTIAPAPDGSEPSPPE